MANIKAGLEGAWIIPGFGLGPSGEGEMVGLLASAALIMDIGARSFQAP
ncbi:hypothetical protein [Aquabacterium soli]|jgi:hypothetical protein|nr:hypothetical protein [Aquabacterium soli]